MSRPCPERALCTKRSRPLHVDDNDKIEAAPPPTKANGISAAAKALQARFAARLAETDADVEFATAERLFGELEMPFYLAVTQLEHAEWLIAQDRRDEAEPLLAEARETFERLRATPWLERLTAAQHQKQAQIPA